MRLSVPGKRMTTSFTCLPLPPGMSTMVYWYPGCRGGWQSVSLNSRRSLVLSFSAGSNVMRASGMPPNRADSVDVASSMEIMPYSVLFLRLYSVKAVPARYPPTPTTAAAAAALAATSCAVCLPAFSAASLAAFSVVSLAAFSAVSFAAFSAASLAAFSADSLAAFSALSLTARSAASFAAFSADSVAASFAAFSAASLTACCVAVVTASLAAC